MWPICVIYEEYVRKHQNLSENTFLVTIRVLDFFILKDLFFTYSFSWNVQNVDVIQQILNGQNTEVDFWYQLQ